ncbi:MAG: FHA domain-containing serine/threonine-protein kinase [Planctomycetota bacterium]
MDDIGLLPLHALGGSPKIPLPEHGELVLGRDPGGTGVKIADPRCSRRHAAVWVTDGKIKLRDMGSKNGTWVNGKRVEDAVTLQVGDHVRIGHAEFALVGPSGEYRCACCMETFITAPPEAPFSTECRRKYPLLGATLADRRLVRGLGSGSFGSVYVGHRRGNPYVAVKVLHVEFTETPDAVMKFLREAYATSGIEHDNIVRFGDSGHEGGHWYIILEYFPSESLGTMIEEQGKLPLDQSLAIIKQVGEGLQYAHDRKLLHRDVKPGNILVGDGGLVKMVDFGLAKRLVDSAFTSHTQTGTAGTPLFMAPELMMGERATTGADIYSMAATLYRMLTGRHPIEARRLDEWMAAIQSQPPPPARSLNPDIPTRISDVLDIALKKTPGERPGSVAEFLKQLGLG